MWARNRSKRLCCNIYYGEKEINATHADGKSKEEDVMDYDIDIESNAHPLDRECRLPAILDCEAVLQNETNLGQ